MPGAFAHITLVNMLKETKRLDALGGFPDAQDVGFAHTLTAAA